MAAFSEFINDESLPQAQIVFMKKMIDYIVQNGYIDNVSDLTKPPFYKPQSFVRLFDRTKQKKLIDLVSKVKENAIKVNAYSCTVMANTMPRRNYRPFYVYPSY